VGYTILLVDDSDTVRAVLEKTLRVSGVEVGDLHQAADGKEALAVLKNAWVDLVITDLNMPEMNGFELIDAMLADEVFRKIPVIVVTTEGSAERVDSLKQKGIEAYVRKPFTPERIKEAVDKVMGGVHG
jgi:two-component system, chemotaxis family, chemotaxis protein CheY